MNIVSGTQLHAEQHVRNLQYATCHVFRASKVHNIQQLRMHSQFFYCLALISAVYFHYYITKIFCSRRILFRDLSDTAVWQKWQTEVQNDIN